jgi:hypothetical protein
MTEIHIHPKSQRAAARAHDIIKTVADRKHHENLAIIAHNNRSAQEQKEGADHVQQPDTE